MLLILLTWREEARAEEIELTKGYATAYCLDGITASGEEVRKGIAAVSDKFLINSTILIYKRLPDDRIGDLIGIYEVKDTGCAERVVDVWCPEDECQDFMNLVYEDGCQGKIFIQIIKEAKG